MKQYFFIFLIVGFLFVIGGCASLVPIAATSNPVGGKIGESSIHYIFGIFPLNIGGGGVLNAARNGGITEIATVDQKTTHYFGFWKTVTTVVSGQ